MKVTDEMVNRFLTWKLPAGFSPDGGVTFRRDLSIKDWPSGTNLLTAEQAKAMLEHVLEGHSALPPGWKAQRVVQTPFHYIDVTSPDNYHNRSSQLAVGPKVMLWKLLNALLPK